MMKSCVVPECSTGYNSIGTKRSLFKVPNDENLRKKWEALVPGVSSLNPNQFLCDRHFQPSCIVRRYVRHDVNGRLIADVLLKRPYLNADAVPTIFLPEDGESDLDDEKSDVDETALHVSQQQCIKGEALTNDEFCTEEIIIPPTTEMNTSLNSNVTSDEGDVRNPATEAEKVNSTYFQPKMLLQKDLPNANAFASRLQVLSTGSVGDDNVCITLPQTWSVSKSNRKLGTEISFCRVITIIDNDIKSLLIRKYFVIENWNNQIQYYVHGRKVCTDKTQLPNVLGDVPSLPIILAKFERMCACQGAGSIDPTFIQGDGFRDQSNSWHHNECELLLNTNSCSNCRILKKTIWQRRRRAVNRSATVKRVSRTSNPRDQLKLDILRKRLKAQQKNTNRAKKRIEFLKHSLRQKKLEVNTLRVETIKDSKYEIPSIQKMVSDEIISAAKTKQQGRRYSKEWLNLCRTMYGRSQTYYEFLRTNNILPLASEKTLRNFTRLPTASADSTTNAENSCANIL